MANINIDDQQGVLHSNSPDIPVGSNTVSFHSTIPCTVCIEQEETFGVTSFNIVPNVTVTLHIAKRTTTHYIPIVPLGAQCHFNHPVGPRQSSPGMHTITMT